MKGEKKGEKNRPDHGPFGRDFRRGILGGDQQRRRKDSAGREDRYGCVLRRGNQPGPLGSGWGDDILLGLLGGSLSFEAKLDAANAGNANSMVEVANAYLNGGEVETALLSRLCEPG